MRTYTNLPGLACPLLPAPGNIHTISRGTVASQGTQEPKMVGRLPHTQLHNHKQPAHPLSDPALHQPHQTHDTNLQSHNQETHTIAGNQNLWTTTRVMIQTDTEQTKKQQRACTMRPTNSRECHCAVRLLQSPLLHPHSQPGAASRCSRCHTGCAHMLESAQALAVQQVVHAGPFRPMHKQTACRSRSPLLAAARARTPPAAAGLPCLLPSVRTHTLSAAARRFACCRPLHAHTPTLAPASLSLNCAACAVLGQLACWSVRSSAL